MVDYALRLKREYPRQRLWPIAYANDVFGYVPSRRVLEEGGYEGGGAMLYYGRLGPFDASVEERIMASVAGLMSEYVMTIDCSRRRFIGALPVLASAAASSAAILPRATVDSSGRAATTRATGKPAILGGEPVRRGPFPPWRSLPAARNTS